MVKNGNIDMRLVLASASPRRLDILRSAGFDPIIVKPDCGEDIHIGLSPAQTVMSLALRKAGSAEKLLDFDNYLLISCDTVVVLDGEILGKPEDEDDAVRMLSLLRNRMHSVFSGVCLSLCGKKKLLFDRSDVYFGDYSDEEIRAYVKSGEPMDKAGSYALQGEFGKHVVRLDGSRSNVIGLPIEKILREEEISGML